MTNLSPPTVQKPVDNLRTPDAKPTNAPDWDMLAKFQPTEPWVPATFRENCIFAIIGIAVIGILVMAGRSIWS